MARAYENFSAQVIWLSAVLKFLKLARQSDGNGAGRTWVAE